jgi:hypothetical protein
MRKWQRNSGELHEIKMEENWKLQYDKDRREKHRFISQDQIIRIIKSTKSCQMILCT